MKTAKVQVKTLSQLGKIFSSLSKEETWPGYEIGLSEEEYSNGISAVNSAVHHNGWFTPTSVRTSLENWSKVLTETAIESWLASYTASNSSRKKVGVIMAGNIPMVGLHDLLSVISSGNVALVKLSSKDRLLMMMVISFLQKLDPNLSESIKIIEGKLEGFDAVIATGSNNSARYFEYYFKSKPSIIRKNRTSVAVLTGNETADELHGLGEDIFTYFGLGCRNVTKLYVPKNYDLDVFFNAIYAFKELANHNKYANNYDYHRAIWLMNQDDLLENGFILLKEDKALVSPVGSLYYERYENYDGLISDLNTQKDELQCIVSSSETPFGRAQQPNLTDYADGVDTMSFLSSL